MVNDERDSWEAPRNMLYNLRELRERVFVWSVGVQQYGSNEWSVGEPGNMTGNRPTPSAEKVEPSETWT